MTMLNSVPVEARYTQRLAKGGALLSETRVLLEAWRTGETATKFEERVGTEDILGRVTARRALDIARVFTRRFLTPDDAPARHLKRLVEGNAPRQLVNDLIFYYAARQDDLLRDFVTMCYWPLVREGRLTIANSDVRSLILEAELDRRIPKPWSAEIKRDMAGRVMITLTDFGFLRELKPARREVLPYHVADGTLVYLAYLLHYEGVTDGLLARQWPWALFGLEPADVWYRLDALSADGWFIVQRAGEVVQLTWKYNGLEEVVDALAG